MHVLDSIDRCEIKLIERLNLVNWNDLNFSLGVVDARNSRDCVVVGHAVLTPTFAGNVSLLCVVRHYKAFALLWSGFGHLARLLGLS